MSKLSEWAWASTDEVYCLECASDITGLYMTKRELEMEFHAIIGLHPYIIFG